MKKTLPVGGIKYGIRWVMLQIGSCCNNHLIINVIFKRLGVKAGKDSLPFAIFVTQNKENELLLSGKTSKNIKFLPEVL